MTDDPNFVPAVLAALQQQLDGIGVNSAVCLQAALQRPFSFPSIGGPAMDRTVPAGAASLLAFIARTETSRDFPDAYEVIYGHNQAALPKRLTAMTLAEVQGSQASWSRRFGSSATGAYQFMKATLAGLIGELGLRPSQVLDGNLQDRLAYHLLKRRGYDAWAAGRIDDVEFAKRLAMEWASFPVLAPTQGSTRTLKAGQSYYSGDGLNKALVSPDAVRAELAKARALLSAPLPPAIEPDVDIPDPIPTSGLPEPEDDGRGMGLLGWAIVAGIIIAAFAAILLTPLF